MTASSCEKLLEALRFIESMPSDGMQSIKASDIARAAIAAHEQREAEQCPPASAHTPEPWKVLNPGKPHVVVVTEKWDSTDGTLICYPGRHTSAVDTEVQANAQRIVACVNACAGIADPQSWRETMERMIALRCLKHATIPPTILPPATQECGLCMREEGILVGRIDKEARDAR
jgi:hypothetical protein